jgi:hypothetical protein
VLSVTNRPVMLNVQGLMGNNLNVAWPKFLTLNLPVFVMNEFVRHKQTSPHLGSWAQSYKTFPVRNLRIFVISTVSPWQVFSSLVSSLQLRSEPTLVKHP